MHVGEHLLGEDPRLTEEAMAHLLQSVCLLATHLQSRYELCALSHDRLVNEYHPLVVFDLGPTYRHHIHQLSLWTRARTRARLRLRPVGGARGREEGAASWTRHLDTDLTNDARGLDLVTKCAARFHWRVVVVGVLVVWTDGTSGWVVGL